MTDSFIANYSYVEAATAIASLKAARSEGDLAGTEQFAMKANRAMGVRESKKDQIMTLEERLAFQSFRDLIERVADSGNAIRNEDILVVVRDKLNELMRSGSPPGSVFYEYMNTVGAPVRSALTHLSNAAIQRERAITVMLRTIDSSDSTTESLLTDSEKRLLQLAKDTYGEIRGAKLPNGEIRRASLPNKNHSSVVKLSELRSEINSIFSDREVVRSREVCFYAGVNRGIEDCTYLSSGLNVWGKQYPGGSDSDLLSVVPIDSMDSELKKISEILYKSLGSARDLQTSAQWSFPSTDSAEIASKVLEVISKGSETGNTPLPLAVNNGPGLDIQTKEEIHSQVEIPDYIQVENLNLNLSPDRSTLETRADKRLCKSKQFSTALNTMSEGITLKGVSYDALCDYVKTFADEIY